MRPQVLFFAASMALSAALHAEDNAPADGVASNPAPAAVTTPSTPTREQLLAVLPGKRMSYVDNRDRTVQWINNADGTAAVRRSAGLSGKNGAGSSAPAHWSVSDDGRFCMDIDWPANHGGPSHWCREVSLDAGGAPVLKPDAQ
jgi:hypothetical protein